MDSLSKNDSKTLDSIDCNTLHFRDAIEQPTSIGKEVSDNTFSTVDVADPDIIIDRVRAVTIRVPVEIEEQSVRAVVDTGAEVTVMSELCFNVFLKVDVLLLVKLREIL